MNRDTMQPEILPAGEPTLTLDSSLQAAIGAFEQHMQDEGFAVNTQKAFLSDLRLLGKYLGIGQPIGDVATKNLDDFLKWLQYERGVPCSPKSYARRVTTLKVFFGWLHDKNVLLANPASTVIQLTVSSPLPEVPTLDEVAAALDVTAHWRQGKTGAKKDVRPDLLLNLLLQTGIKKGEAMAIVPNHIDRSEPTDPFLFVRYRNPRLRYKERKIALDPSWLLILDEYLTQYRPPDTLFTCTARNLEYILRDVGDAAGIPHGRLSFENLRWRSAMDEYAISTEPDKVRQRLGLSKVTWRETKSKIERLITNEKEG
jgi:integrase/recombinase XerD